MKKTLQDIKTYLDYLDKEGYSVSFDFSEKAPEPCRAELAGFEIKSVSNAKAVYRGGILSCYCADGKKENDPLLVPLRYLFDKLNEQCGEHEFHDSVSDAYEKSLVFIHKHYPEGITVSDIAESFGYSRSYFGYIFKKMHGITANRYIQQLRLARAAELLCSTRLSVSAVAEAVGFDDANYFSTVFKNSYGMPPRQYRLHGSKKRID